MGPLACTELVIVCIRQRAPAITIITLIYSERKEHTSARILYGGMKLALALFLVDAIYGNGSKHLSHLDFKASFTFRPLVPTPLVMNIERRKALVYV